MELLRVAKPVGFALLAYVGLVVAFETMLGVVQPETGDTIVITTTDPDGVSSDRVLGRDFAGGQHYASANHWPRAWYNNALKNPRVQVTMDAHFFSLLRRLLPRGIYHEVLYRTLPKVRYWGPQSGRRRNTGAP